MLLYGVKAARLRPESASMTVPVPIAASAAVRMPETRKKFTETGPLVALAVAVALLGGIVGPASRKFFNSGGFGAGPPRPPQAVPQRGGGGFFGGDFFSPFQQQPQ